MTVALNALLCIGPDTTGTIEPIGGNIKPPFISHLIAPPATYPWPSGDKLYPYLEPVNPSKLPEILKVPSGSQLIFLLAK